MIGFELLEGATVGIMYEIESVASGSRITKNWIVMIVFENEVSIFFLLHLFSGLRGFPFNLVWRIHQVLWHLLVFHWQILECEIWGEGRDETFARFHLGAFGPNCGMTSNFFAHFDVGLSKSVSNQEEQLFAHGHVFTILSWLEMEQESLYKLSQVINVRVHGWNDFLLFCCDQIVDLRHQSGEKVSCLESNIFASVIANSNEAIFTWMDF